MKIRLVPINDDNKDAVLSLSVRDDQHFVAPNEAMNDIACEIYRNAKE